MLRAAGDRGCARRGALRSAFRITSWMKRINSSALVIDYFTSEYQAGRTPNPCVMCNEKLKFGNLWGKAEALGCDYIATGHYAIIEHQPDRAVLRKGRRSAQGSVLFSFQSAAAATAARALSARRDGEAGDPGHRPLAWPEVADKVDSQEICFVPGNDYKAFLALASRRG